MHKAILTGLLLFWVFAANAQNETAQIDAKVPDFFNGEWAFLKNSRGVGLDSAMVENGQFRFHTKMKEPMLVNIYLKKDAAVFNDKFYIQAGKVKITAGFNNDHKITEKSISRNGATDVQDKWVEYNKYMSALQDSIRKVQSRYTAVFSKSDTSLRRKLKDEMDQLNHEKQSLQVSYVKQNRDSYVSYLILKDMLGPVPAAGAVTLVQDLYSQLSSRIRNYPSAMDFEKDLNRFAALAIGKTAPGFTSTAPNGEKISLAEFRGKYVLLDFWASWCIPCRAENPVLVKAYHKFNQKNFDILSVSLDQSGEKGKAAWLKAIQDDRMPWKHVSDLAFWDSPIAKLYAIKAVPQNFLIDPAGKIIATNLRGPALEKELEKIFPN